jgi:hypothetical protein
MTTLWGDEARTQRMGEAARTRAATLFSAEKMTMTAWRSIKRCLAEAQDSSTTSIV